MNTRLRQLDGNFGTGGAPIPRLSSPNEGNVVPDTPPDPSLIGSAPGNLEQISAEEKNSIANVCYRLDVILHFLSL